MGKAIVLGCDNVGLGVIRSLAAAGIKIMAVPTEEYEFAHFSRFVTTKTRIISPIKENDRLLDFLLNAKDDWDGALLMPTNDASVVFVAQNREALSARYVPAVQEWDVIKRILNKGSLYRQAEKIGIPIPEVLFPDSVDFLNQRQDELSYPCILKPYETHRFFPVFGKKLFVINSFEELVEKFTEVQRNDLKVMVSEIIPGADDCFYHYRSYINGQGDILAEMCTQKLRQNPPGFGVARVARTVPMIEEIGRLALSLLKSFTFHGLSSAEFKFDSRDNQFKLIEINVRSALPERLLVAAGINFPYIIYLDRVKDVRILPPTYEPETYWIDNFMDIPGFIKWRNVENWTFKDYLRPYWKKKVFCVPFFDDPLPFIVKSWILLKQVAKSCISRLYLKSVQRGRQGANKS